MSHFKALTTAVGGDFMNGVQISWELRDIATHWAETSAGGIREWKQMRACTIRVLHHTSGRALSIHKTGIYKQHHSWRPSSDTECEKGAGRLQAQVKHNYEKGYWLEGNYTCIKTVRKLRMRLHSQMIFTD